MSRISASAIGEMPMARSSGTSAVRGLSRTTGEMPEQARPEVEGRLGALGLLRLETRVGPVVDRQHPVDRCEVDLGGVLLARAVEMEEEEIGSGAVPDHVARRRGFCGGRWTGPLGRVMGTRRGSRRGSPSR